ncbi:molecular chaperone TorD family protein [Adlercreutzia sp. ZJ304]|uniref:TorD/DmsD family molecular chaperone n=1 Tax=Adlercreutzia sp. ZJ304 TaxID=2709791 RepID=UPI0013EC1F33|nr:molecular chaperone TorD family protein [Adlercreutzia sp. ZJ304]
MKDSRLEVYADVLAFLGNSLLKPITQTPSVGLESSFWETFPNFDNEEVQKGIDKCLEFARKAGKRKEAGEDVVENTAVEYTKLFIGPPSPSAFPWETMYQGKDISVGFGEPTIKMQNILRDMGLEVSNSNNQYADHIGIELLALSEMCRRVNGGELSLEDMKFFIDEHPRAWIGALRDKVSEVYPDGYYACILDLSDAVMRSLENA